MRLKLHKFQQKAFFSEKKVIVTTAGIQGGKSMNGALWLGNKTLAIPKDWNSIMCAPTYKIMTAATVPTFLKIYGKWGEYKKVDSYFEFHTGQKVWIRSLNDPNAMEGITNVGAVWLDEGGLISRYAWENVRGRAAFRSAPIMVTTTPYALNWLFQLWKDWKAGKTDYVDFISFRSIDNPYFPREEYEREKKLLDPRRFAMKYDGLFGQMEGLVYEQLPKIRAFALPAGTTYYAGVDWGFRDPFVITVRAITPDGIHYRVSEFYKTGLTISEIVDVCKARKQVYNIKTFVCDPSRPDSILELNKAGLNAIGGNNEIRLGIDKQIQLMRANKWFIFEDENPNGLDEYSMYHYPEPKDLGIDDDSRDPLPVDAHNHGCDSDRYVTMHLEASKAAAFRKVRRPHDPSNTESPENPIDRLDWLKKGGTSRYNVS
jgi:hypothetical protein